MCKRLRRTAPRSLVLASLLLGLSVEVDSSAVKPRFHAVTYSNVVDSRMSLPLATADLHGFSPVVLGYGFEAAWAYGLSAMANLVRDYIFNRTDPDDVVLFFDAYDVIFQGSESEIMSRYLEMEKSSGRKLIYHAEKYCSSKRKTDYPVSESPWHYLNCGLYIGRSHALRDLYKDALPNQLVDQQGKPMRLQNWHTDYYLDHQDRAALDTKCALMQVVDNIDDMHSEYFHPEVKGLKVVDGRLHNTITGTIPLILHFPGSGHWPDWRHPVRTGTCPAYEFFRSAGHPKLAGLLERQVDGHRFFGQRPWKKFCTDQVTWFDRAAMRVVAWGDSLTWMAFNYSAWPLLGAGAIMVTLVAFLMLRRFRRFIPALGAASRPALSKET